MKLDVKIEGHKAIVRFLGNLPLKVIPNLVDALNTYVIKLADHIVTQKLSGQVLKVRTGTLRSSIVPILAHMEGRVIMAGVGTGVKYARIHEFGGTIVPKVAQALTVPLPGVKGRARDYKNTFIAKGMIFQKQGREIIPLFALKKSVTIPARPYFRPSLIETIGDLTDGLDRALDKAIEES